MRVILCMATSVDGFIAKKDGNSDWVSEEDSALFEEKVKKMGCIILGKRTFDQFRGELYPFKGVTNIVITSDATHGEQVENTVFAFSPQETLKIAEERGHSGALLIGGGTTNGMFLKENLIDEIFLSMYPLIFGEGIKLFEKCGKELQLELMSTKQLGGGVMQLHYSISHLLQSLS